MDNIYIPTKNIAEKIAAEFGTPTFVTSAKTLRHRVNQIKQSFDWSKTKIFYAIKANFNPTIVRVLKEGGIDGIDTVSPFEVELALSLGFLPQQIIFTGNNSTDEEIKFVQDKGVLQNIGSLSELQRFANMFSGQKVSIRLNPNVGAGENEKIITGGTKTKFGIALDEFEQAKKIITENNLQLIGIHCHIGSGFYEAEIFKQAVQTILNKANHFSDLQFVDFGGGYGVRYRLDEKPLALDEFNKAIKPLLENFAQKNGQPIEVRLEPGKFLVAESTVLLVRVNTIKQNNGITFIGTDSGFNHLVRPVMYDSYHHIVNISNPDDEMKTVCVVGNICESGDIFNKEIKISNPREGDLLAILTAGAYGSSMSSLYNLRSFAAEVLVDDDIKLTRKRLTFKKVMNNNGFDI